MSDFDSVHNRVVGFDTPVADLDRAQAFYAGVLRIKVHREEFNGYSFCVLDHDTGNGGCLVPDETAISATGGVLVHLNLDRRIRDACAQAERRGGRITEPIRAIGPHGFRALAVDREGNRVALHSTVDA